MLNNKLATRNYYLLLVMLLSGSLLLDWLPAPRLASAASVSSSSISSGVRRSPQPRATFTPGDLAVVRVGSGSGSLSSNGNPVFIDEYTTSGTLIQTIAMPTTASGSNSAFYLAGTAASEGSLNLSTDGQYLTLAGYAITTTNLPNSSSSTVNRVVARVARDGTLDTSTKLTDAGSGSNSNPRGAVSTDGTNFWLTSGTGGIRYVTLGATTSTPLVSSPTNMRVPEIINGQLYVSSNSGSNIGVNSVGTGLPTTAGQTASLVVGDSNIYAYFLADLDSTVPGLDTAYIANNGGNIDKFSLVGGSWVANGSILAPTITGLTAFVNGTTVTLYGSGGSSSGSGGGTLYKFTDTSGYNGAVSATATTLASLASGSNMAYRGVAFVPSIAAPVITTQPTDQVVDYNTSGSITMAASGSGVTYQLYQGTAPDTSNPISSNSTGSFSLPAATATTNYWVKVSNGGGSANSNTITVRVHPAILTQPQDQTINAGQSATLSVTAGGSTPFSYQWYQGLAGDTSSPVAGATSSSFTTPVLNSTTNYWVQITNTVGSINSRSVTVTVNQPPTISQQPQSQTVPAGQSASLSVTATGTAPLFYQWYSGQSGDTTNPVNGATSSTFTTPALSTNVSYWVQVTNTVGSVNSDIAFINVTHAPTITGQPQDQTIAYGSTATLSVTADGTVPLFYQWYQGQSGDSSSPVAGATSSSFTTPVLTTTTAYWVLVTNTVGSANSNTATVTVGSAPVVPTITGQSPSQTVIAGQSAVLTVTATGTNSLFYQWYEGTPDNSTLIPGATDPTYTTSALNTDTSYFVVVTNTVGSATSDVISLTVITPPTITSQPQDSTVVSGTTATLSVTADGTAPFSYQWYSGTPGNSTIIPGATDPTYTTPALTATTPYFVVVTNTAGSVTSQVATVTVTYPPVITVQPQDQTINAGQSTTLTVTATGTAPLFYHWYEGQAGDTSSPVAGATSNSFTTPVLTATTSYWVAVTNTVDSANSRTATVTVNQPPVITQQPQSQTIVAGNTANLSVTATGTTPFSYQWYQGLAGDTTKPVAGATSSSFTTPVLTVTTSYWVQVSNVAGSANSNTATITVTAAPVGPTITSQPQSQTIISGNSATLTVTATGTAPLFYQWYSGTPANSAVIPGATNPTYTTPGLTATTSYFVVVTNTVGAATSQVATVTVVSTPVITQQPQSQTIVAGNSATLSVTVTGTTPFSYQWYQGQSGDTSKPISGATSAVYTTPVLTATTSYWVGITNIAGSAASNTATVTVTPAPVAPTITSQPQSQTINAGQSATLTVTATGTNPLFYQWYQGQSGDTSKPIAGATSSSFTTPVLTATTSYWVIVTNTVGSASSNTATVTVNPVTPACQQPYAINHMGTDDGSCGTLSFAINQAITATSDVTITFVTTGTISLTNALPVINNTNGKAIRIDGGCATTGLAGIGQPGIQLTGTTAITTSAVRLGNKVTVNGLKFAGFGGYAIEIGGVNNTLTCNWLGTLTGNTAAANSGGLLLKAGATGNRIGLAGQGNLISGNTGYGVRVTGGSSNTLTGNLIGYGLSANGQLVPLRNGQNAISVAGGIIRLGPGNRINER